MFPPDPNNPGPTPDPIPPVVPATVIPPAVPTAVPVPGIVPQDPSRDWEKSYKGLQTAYNTLHTKHETLNTEHTATLGEIETLKQQIKQFETSKADLDTKLQAATAATTDLQTQVTSHLAKLERMTVIMASYPDLAQFEAGGLLPQAATIEELKTKLETFRTAIQTSVTGAVNAKLTGAVLPIQPPPGPPPTRTPEQIYIELMRVAGSQKPDDRAKFLQLRAEWDEANKQQPS